jgi:anti-anti-sigma factor
VKIEAARDGGSALLGLEGRLDREAAEQLSGTIGRLLQQGVRSIRLDLSRVTYASSAATRVLARWHQELVMLRGEVRLAAVPAAVQETFAVVGWEPGLEHPGGRDSRANELRRSSWHAREDVTASGLYEFSVLEPAQKLACRLHGDPGRLTATGYGPADCEAVAFPGNVFGLGLGAIGRGYEECRGRLGELVAVGGCIASFPGDGARMPDYLVGGELSGLPPMAVLASGLSCQGSFSHLIRFSPRPEAAAIPLSELAAVALDAVGERAAGIVIAGETAGLCGARLRRSPGEEAAPLSFELPAVRDWLLFPPERTHVMTTTVIVGVAARTPEPPLNALLRPLGGSTRLHGHFHAAVFAYHPLPQRTVELASLARTLFDSQPLRDVLHLLSDRRGGAGVRESELIRGVAWAAPIA